MALPTSGKPMQFNERYFICYGLGIIAYADREAGNNAMRAARVAAVASVAGKPTHPKPRTQNDVGKSTGASQAVSQAVLFRHFSGRFARPLTPEKLDMDGFWKLEIAIY